MTLWTPNLEFRISPAVGPISSDISLTPFLSCSLCIPARFIPVRAFALRADSRFGLRISITRYPLMLATLANIDSNFSNLFSHARQYTHQNILLSSTHFAG